MIYSFIPMMIIGQNPDPAITPAPELAGDPVAQPTPQPITNVQPDDTKMTVDRKYIEQLRQEAEKSRKALEAIKTQQEQANKEKQLAEMSEIDRLKAKTQELENQYKAEKQARELEMKRAKLINIASSFDVPLPAFVVNQIDVETLNSTELTNDDQFTLMVQDVIMKAEKAGMPIVRQRITPGPSPASPNVGPTNPVNTNFPKPILTTDQQLIQLHNEYIKAVAEGKIADRQSIEQKIRNIEDKMGGIRKPPE